MWGLKCLEDLKIAKEYIIKANHCTNDNLRAWSHFETPWINYLKTRNIETESNEPIFPDKYDVKIFISKSKSYTYIFIIINNLV